MDVDEQWMHPRRRRKKRSLLGPGVVVLGPGVIEKKEGAGNKLFIM